MADGPETGDSQPNPLSTDPTEPPQLTADNTPTGTPHGSTIKTQPGTAHAKHLTPATTPYGSTVGTQPGTAHAKHLTPAGSPRVGGTPRESPRVDNSTTTTVTGIPVPTHSPRPVTGVPIAAGKRVASPRQPNGAPQSHVIRSMQLECWIWYTWTMLVVGIAILVGITYHYHHPKCLVVILAVVPTFAAFGLMHYYKGDSVSMPLLCEMFWMGFVGAIPIAFVEGAVAFVIINSWQDADTHEAALLVLAATLNAFIVAAFLEESFKYICINRVDGQVEDCWFRHPGLPIGTLYCGLAAALGFATIENMLYVWADLSWQVAVVRAVMAVPGHCAGGVLIGVGICEREFYGKKTNFCCIILPSWLFHGFYDWFLMASAVGYEDSEKTGHALSLVGLSCALCVDLVQFYYVYYRIQNLEQVEYTAVAHDSASENKAV